MALIACGGGGGGSNSTGPGPGPSSGAANPAPKPAELSLVVGNIQTFNGTGAKARITQPDGIAVDSADTVMGQIGSLYNPTYLTTESNSS